MKIDWANQAVVEMSILGSLMGVGLIGSLTLWISTKMQSRAARKAFEEFRLSTEAKISEMSAQIAQILELKSIPEPVPAPPMAAVQGMNITTRAKVLRMYRRGEAIPGIAAALSVQQEEVRLLLKLNKLLEIPAA
jgi:hypothetical protein